MINDNTIKLIAKSLDRKCTGRENMISKGRLLDLLAEAKNPIVLDLDSLKEVMHTIRKKKLCTGALIETGACYYITNDQKDIEEYIDYLEKRAKEILSIQKEMKKYINKKNSTTIL